MAKSIGVFRQGFLWVLDANGNGIFDGNGPDFVFPYGGIFGDVPVVGDWKGTGITQVGIFRQGFLWALDADGSHQISFLLRRQHRSAPAPLAVDLSRHPEAQAIEVRPHDLETYDELARDQDDYDSEQ